MKCLIILSSLLWAATVVAQGDQCDLDCHRSAPCENSDADFSDHVKYDDGAALAFHTNSNINGMHCSCPHGWTGLTCNRAYNTCDKDHKCYNGGTCIPGLLDYYGNEQLFCDCSKALDEDGYPYVGKFCEHMSEDDCGSEGLYCVNGGECNPKYPQDGGEACECSEEFTGPHCEYKRTEQVPTCDLDCQNSGICQLGPTASSTEFHDIDHLYRTDTNTRQDHMTCVCPPGWGGKLCDTPKQECGTHHCYNGGTCISRIGDDETPKYHCDCSSAQTVSASYAGRFCQYESTSFCTKEETHNGHIFCVNGGICSGDGTGVESCSCEADYYGPSCEFKRLPVHDEKTPSPTSEGGNTDIVVVLPSNHTDHPTPVPIVHNEHGQHLDELDFCDLQCENHGKCRKGVKDLGIISHIVPHVSELNQTSTNNFEHCICPSDFVGLRCEHEMETCPGGEHVCLHGSKCVKFGDEHGCDCSAQDEHSLSGDSCQHKSTTMCTTGELQPVQPRSFCVNGGTCKSMVTSTEEHEPCICTSEWIGPHCELHKVVVEQSPLSYPEVEVGSIPVTVATTPPQQQQEQQAPMPVVVTNNSNNGTTSAVLAIGIIALFASVVISGGTYIRNKKHDVQLDQRNRLTMALAAHGPDDRGRSAGSSLELRPVTTASMSANAAAGEPEVYLGPPRDEDGHELHSVEII